MAKIRGSDFLRLLNETNAKIAEREAKEAKKNLSVGEDPIRLQREASRRETYGTLRARPKRKRKTHQVRNAFGHINTDEIERG